MSDTAVGELFEVSLDDQIACVFRELRMRESVYARQVENRKMSRDVADRELSRMRAVLKTLEGLK